MKLLNKIFPVFDIETPDGRIYLRRRTMLTLFGFKLMLHHIRLPDYTRDIHDHPWWFFTFILWGGYHEKTFINEEKTRTKIRARKPFRLYFNSLHFSHVITWVPKKGAWTLVFRGRRTRKWGFFTKCGWKPWDYYVDRYYNGIPVCEEE